jgi:methoxymalonate biosynthesis protein
MADQAELVGLVTDLVGERAGGWDRAGRIPAEVIRALAAKGVLCPQVPADQGGPGLTAVAAGELTAQLGSLCGSLRSLQTAHGMAAWAVTRLGSREQREVYLPQLTSGALAGVAFSEPQAGSDLAAMTTRIRDEGGMVVVDGHKSWVTGAGYADLLLVFGRYRDGAAVVAVPTGTAGVEIAPVTDPLGCRAAGHGQVTLTGVRLPADHLFGAGQDLGMLVTSTLTYGRLSVAWGCVGILRCCLAAAVRHAQIRHQFGKPLAAHQLVARHLAELFVAEQAATRTCEHASRCWDARTPDFVPAVVVAKHVAARAATRGAATAMQVLASAGATDGHPVARAYRDAKLMEIIEGSSEISQLLLAEHARAVWS